MRWLLSLFFISSVYATDPDPARHLYKNIKDILNPSYQELLTLQSELLLLERPILEKMPQTGHVARDLIFISEDRPIEYEKLVVNSSEEDRDCCIITYASFNKRFADGVHRLAEAVEESDFRGHMYYRVGGFPNISGGDLTLMHVPFGFKPAFFKEMQSLGYKRVLWLDGSILPGPDISLNFIFDMIKNLGLFVQINDHSIRHYINKECAQAHEISWRKALQIRSCSASIIGFDLTNPEIANLLDTWHALAHHPFGFYSDRSDQNSLSILIDKFKLKERLIPRALLGSLDNTKGNFFLMDRTFVKDDD